MLLTFEKGTAADAMAVAEEIVAVLLEWVILDSVNYALRESVKGKSEEKTTRQGNFYVSQSTIVF